VTDKPDDYKTKADEYQNLADAAVDPEEKKKLKDLARTARNLAPARSHSHSTRSVAARRLPSERFAANSRAGRTEHY
jgi:hypothetical protein